MYKDDSCKKFKICLVIISLGKGGAERSTALMSKMLKSKGHEVHIVILNDEVDYEYEGKLFNLGKDKTKKDNILARLMRFKKLRTYIKEEQFDCIIDNRNRQFFGKELFYLNYLYKGCNTMYVVRSFRLSQYFPKSNWIAKRMIRKAVRVIGVSKAIASEVNSVYETNKACCIYNPIDVYHQAEEENANDGNYVLFLGRLVESVKNFSLLLEAYKRSQLPSKNIALKIVGDGPDKAWLQQKIEQMGLVELVTIFPFTSSVYPLLLKAKFLTLTSYYEGFPRVLIESLSAGIPVVSVDCKSGPNEIVISEKNGLLVENFNAQKLSDAYNRFILDEDLYNHCKEHTITSVLHLKQEEIAEQWNKLLQDELHEPR